MDLNKTGALIAALRKEKNMTQKDLAEKIGVTDKAVSRWETGKGFPDVSLLAPLAGVFDISISEIVMGEKIEVQENSIVETMDKVLTSALDYSQSEIRRTNRKVLYWSGNILPILVSIIIYAFIPQGSLYLWVRYDAVIVPLFLLAFNFILEHKEFKARKILIIIGVESFCVLLHMTYFGFDLSATSVVIWSLMIGIIIAITAIIGLVLYFISKWRRNKG